MWLAATCLPAILLESSGVDIRITVANKLGLYRQCAGASKTAERAEFGADALPIQPVVVSRGILAPLMGIECLSAFVGSVRVVLLPRGGVPSAAVWIWMAG